MAQVVFNHVGGKPPFFDGTCYDYWKRKMKMYLGSINDQVWDVTESDYAIIDPDNLTNQDKANKQCNTMALNTIYNAIDSRCLNKSRIVKEQMRYGGDWRKHMRAHWR